MSPPVSAYFAYGSNLNPERVRVRGIVYEQVVAARLSGYVLRFQKRSREHRDAGHANIVNAPDGVVQGALYHLRHPAEIAKMDPYERVPVNYIREVVTVDTDAGPVSAWTYFANQAVLGDGLKPPRWYMDHLLAGEAFLTREYYEWLTSIECLP